MSISWDSTIVQGGWYKSGITSSVKQKERSWGHTHEILHLHLIDQYGVS